MEISREKELQNRIVALNMQLQNAEEELREEMKISSEKRELERQANWIAQRNKERVFHPGDVVVVRCSDGGNDYHARIKTIRFHRDSPERIHITVSRVIGIRDDIILLPREIVKILSSTRNAPISML